MGKRNASWIDEYPDDSLGRFIKLTGGDLQGVNDERATSDLWACVCVCFFHVTNIIKLPCKDNELLSLLCCFPLRPLTAQGGGRDQKLIMDSN